jgi:hypothetical protein
MRRNLGRQVRRDLVCFKNHASCRGCFLTEEYPMGRGVLGSGNFGRGSALIFVGGN